MAAVPASVFGSAANEPSPSPPNRYVYVIGPPVGLQKVGIATDPKQRLATLQTACPFDLFLHLAVAVPFGEAHAIERAAHRLLARSCVRNEWFEATAAEAIQAVQTAVAGRAAKVGQTAPRNGGSPGPDVRQTSRRCWLLGVRPDRKPRSTERWCQRRCRFSNLSGTRLTSRRWWTGR